MRILLDTTYLYRLMALERGPEGVEGNLYVGGRGPVFASVVSLCEMRIKYQARHRSGIRKSPHDPEQVARTLEDLSIPILPLSPLEAIAPLVPSLAHRDPFDEMLLVQAQHHGLRLLTRDQLLRGHPAATTL